METTVPPIIISSNKVQKHNKKSDNCKKSDHKKLKKKCSHNCHSKVCKYCAILSDSPQYLGAEFLIANDVTTHQLTSKQIFCEEIKVNKLINNGLLTERFNMKELIFTTPIYYDVDEFIGKPIIRNDSDNHIVVTTVLTISILYDEGEIIKMKVLDKYKDILSPHHEISIRVFYKGPLPSDFLTLAEKTTTYLSLTIDKGILVDNGLDDIIIKYSK